MEKVPLSGEWVAIGLTFNVCEGKHAKQKLLNKAKYSTSSYKRATNFLGAEGIALHKVDSHQPPATRQRNKITVFFILD